MDILVTDLEGNTFGFSLLSMMLAMGLSYMDGPYFVEVLLSLSHV